MTYIIRGLTFLLIPVIVNGVIGCLLQPKQAKKGQVHLPMALAILGMITAVPFLIPAIITVFADEPVWVPLIFLMLSVLGTSLIIGFVNCRISYDEEGFTAKNFFGIKRRFTYDQVTGIKEDMNETYIYVGKRRVMVDGLATGGIQFIYVVRKKYGMIHNGRHLPKINSSKDLFHGHVNDVAGVLFSYILCTVVAIGLVVVTLCYTFTPSTPDNTIEQSVCFVSCEVKKDEVVLYSEEGQIYSIRFMNAQFDATDIRAICDGEKIVTTYSKEVTPKIGDKYYSVKAIRYEGKDLLTFEETDRFHRQEYWPIVLIAVVLCLVWGAYMVASVIVGRNPGKYSKRVVRWFFKDGYITY